MHDSASALVRRLRGRTLLEAVKRACTGIGLLFLLITLTPLTRWWSAAMAGSFANPPTDGDVLIILGGSALTDGTIGGSSYWRAVYGVRIWRTGHYRHVLVCGGNSDGVAVSAAIRDYLVSQSVQGSSITAGGYGKSNPIADNSTNSGRAQNRRVELVVSGASIGIQQEQPPSSATGTQQPPAQIVTPAKPSVPSSIVPPQ